MSASDVVEVLVAAAAWTGAVVLAAAMWQTIWQTRGEGQVEHQDRYGDVPYDQELDGTDLAEWNEELR